MAASHAHPQAPSAAPTSGTPSRPPAASAPGSVRYRQLPDGGREILDPTPWGIPEIDAVPLVQDRWQVWIEEHPADLAPYEGQCVLIHPTRGVLAHGPFGVVYDAVDQLPEVDRDAVLILSVPRSGWA